MKIYTKSGDGGETSLFGGARVGKDNARIEAYGTLDELNSALGLARAAGPPAELDDPLGRIQGELFELGARLASGSGAHADRHPGPGQEHVDRLEAEIDRFEAALPPLKQFILPGGGAVAGALHLARTICRRAERLVVSLERSEPDERAGLIYLNRLSDWLFVAARTANQLAGIEDVTWRP